MSSAQVPAPIYTDDAVVGWQSNSRGGGLLRSRIPTGVINATQTQDGEYFHYEVYQTDRPFTIEIPAGTTLIAWPIAAEDAKPRNIIEERKAASAAKGGPAKGAGSKKDSAKRGAKKGGVTLDDDVFGDEGEFEDDGSEAPVQQAPATRIAGRQQAAAPIQQTQTATSRIAQRPAQAPAIAGPSPRQPRREGPIPKPSQTRRGGGGNVRYSNLPE